MSQQKAVAVFSNRGDINNAFEALRQSDFPNENLSMILRDFEEQVGDIDVTSHEARRGAAVGTVTGTVLGMVGGLALAASTSIVLPGIGSVIVAGPLASVVSTLVGGGAGGISGGVLGLFTDIGLSDPEAEVFSSYLANGGYLLLFEGDEDQMASAESILRQQPGLQKLTVITTGKDSSQAVTSVNI